MSFQVQVGTGGYAGWKLLQRTRDTQIELIGKEAGMQATRDYVAEKLPRIGSAEELVSDYRLLKVTLSAFGLESDINNKFFIQKVLSEGTTEKDAFANRLADKRYAAMADALRLDTPDTAATRDAGYAGTLFSNYTVREFERRVGEVDDSLRLALNAERELGKLGGQSSSDNTKWYSILGSKPLRTVFEGAFGFGSAYGKLPIDRQLEEFRDKAEQVFGSPEVSNFSDPKMIEKLVQTYVLRSQVTASQAQSPYSTALAILTS